MRIAVVGTCASGKSTVVDELRRRGYDAFVVSQEHSVVRDLWNHQHPDALIYLRADYRTIQSRRGASWPRWIYDLQIARLQDAREHAAITLDTGVLNKDATIQAIIAWIEHDSAVS